MEYNTQRTKIALPEYGRHIHKMIQWVKNIENRDERNRQIRAVVSVMGNLNPHLRDINDFKHKLWDHVQVISNFDIDIDSPYPLPSAETFHEKPRKILYPTKPIRIRHYGRNIQTIVDSIVKQENPEIKEKQIQILANHMRKSYLTWNKDTVTDEIIVRDISILSGGAIVVDPTSIKQNGSHVHYGSNGGAKQAQKNGRSNNPGQKNYQRGGRGNPRQERK